LNLIILLRINIKDYFSEGHSNTFFFTNFIYIYLNKNETAKIREIIKIKFKGSRSLRAKREITKNKGKVKKKAVLIVKNSLKRKKIIRDIRKIRDKITDQ